MVEILETRPVHGRAAFKKTSTDFTALESEERKKEAMLVASRLVWAIRHSRGLIEGKRDIF